MFKQKVFGQEVRESGVVVDEDETRLGRARVSSTQRDRYATRQAPVTRLSHKLEAHTSGARRKEGSQEDV
ncbi:hypothetical protein TRAPUB_5824 [Trametes pubescens]|uniref:Uncharacterized protein n=1 Tax=Trametes pubescens TaxID=154538 RepID=A0A1M2V7J1_TRAPU|nr:hypothetical protein TRAPUB_5824 [Trametes pubescens]